MTPLDSLLLALGILVASACAALLFARTGRIAQIVAVGGVATGSALGLLASLQVLATGRASELAAHWQVPGGALVVGVDALSAFFLAALFAFSPFAAVFGRAYLAHRDREAHGAVSSAVLCLLIAAMALVLLARHGMLFLVAWEAMALLAYLLITTDHGDPEVRRAGWTYLIASHVGVLALIGLFLGLASRAGGALDFAAFGAGAGLTPGAALPLLALALIGFGIKAGVVGLHVWLPEAHAAAPSHVSALMSGVLVKLGVYGLLRATQLLPVPEAAGATLMSLGIAGALGGIALALQQRDLKRTLAYSTIENVGIVLFGIGFGFWARSRGLHPLACLAFAGALLHVWNHCAIKGLLFLAAGSVVHATGTKDLERLGGLLRRMPVTGAATVLAAAAIAGLPPLNGLVGEWLLYRGLASTALEASSWAGTAAIAGLAALALVGGLATLCFVRLVGIALLGEPRSDGARRAHESGLQMTTPLALLALGCIGLSLASPLLVSAIALPVQELSGGPVDLHALRTALAPLATFNAGLLAAIAAGVLLFARRVRNAASDETWGCGYTAPSARMQYTASSFGDTLADRVMPRWLRARTERRAPGGLFPRAANFSARHEDPLTRGVYEPLLERWGDRFSRLRWLQQGKLHIYLVYIAGVAVFGLFWSALRSWWTA
ncbi:MAG TPA: proton-conducting transporter membrane subunit [Myxococcota bacterium]|nr:proton-conducting transporter membrane subunit [Myxococcota bacterium]